MKILVLLLLCSTAIAQTPPPTPCTIDLYRITQNLSPTGVGDLVMTVTGTVPSGIPCDVTEFINVKGIVYYRVNRTTTGITYKDNNRPATVYAICS